MVYLVKHVFDTDGGFGDAVEVNEILFATLDKLVAERYIADYSNTQVYEQPYSCLEYGCLVVEEVELTDSPTKPDFEYFDDKRKDYLEFVKRTS